MATPPIGPPTAWSWRGCRKGGSPNGVAYEFFKGLGGGRDTRSGPGTSPNAGRSSTIRADVTARRISYDAGLERYLWCQTLPGGDARFRGGFGIYDAPEPWGPWTTVVLHRGVGRRAGRDEQLPDEMDERRREDGPPGLLGRRLFLRPQGDAGHRPIGRPALSASVGRCSRHPYPHSSKLRPHSWAIRPRTGSGSSSWRFLR